jgi:hypothetical protein
MMSNKNLEFYLSGLLGGTVLGAALMAMFESIAPVLFGSPMIILSILVPFFAILYQRGVWILAGAFLAIPFSFYLGATPRFRWIGMFLPLLHLAAAYAVWQGRRWLAWLTLLPYVVLVAWLGWSVLNQFQ